MKVSSQRGALSRERILRAALAIVDREGLEAVSMRRVGEELGVEAMSLYNHVENKAAMLDGIFEIVLGELAPPQTSSSWQVALGDRARALRAVLRRHPNALPIFATRPAVTPASIGHVEAVLQILRSAGFGASDALSVLSALSALVVGHTLACYAPARADERARPDYAALDEEEFPRVREAARLLPSHDAEAELDYGLDALLRGFADKLAQPRTDC